MSSKQTQREANYRRGNPVNHCGVCAYYQGHSRCSQVLGAITPYGVSDVFKPLKNPFGSTLAPREIQAIKLMAADAADRSSVLQCDESMGDPPANCVKPQTPRKR
jgi:hypothetical protein